MVPSAAHDVLATTTDRRLTASSTLEIPGGFLRICVLASRRRWPFENAVTHGENH